MAKEIIDQIVKKRLELQELYNKATLEEMVSSSKIVVIPKVNKCISKNLPIFNRILHDLETTNYPFSNHYLYNPMPMTFYPLLVPQVKAS